MSYQYFIFILLFVTSFLFTYGLVPKVINFCFRNDLLEVPEERKEHLLPMPRLGGFALITGTLLTTLFFIIINFEFKFIELDTIKLFNLSFCSILIYILGTCDDLYNLKAYPRLIGQFLIALLAYYMGFRIEYIDLNLLGKSEYLFSQSSPCHVDLVLP